MVLTAFLSVMLWAGPVEATLLRLEPTTALEREALEAIRADGTVTWTEATLARSLSKDAQRLAMSGFVGAGKALVWVVSFESSIDVHSHAGTEEERVRTLSFDSSMSAASVSENVAALVRSQLILLTERKPASPVESPSPLAAVEKEASATQQPALPPAVVTPPARFRLGLGYVGGSLGAQLGYQNGVQLSAKVLWRLLQAGVRVDVFATVPVKNAVADFDVARQALSLTAGPKTNTGRWRFCAEAGFNAERFERTSLRSLAGTPTMPKVYLLPSLVADVTVGLGNIVGPFGVELMVRTKIPVRTLEFVSSADEKLASTAAVRIEAALSVVFER